jgi:hypothetical protein
MDKIRQKMGEGWANWGQELLTATEKARRVE